MNHAVRLLISFLFSLSAYATCPDAPTSALECRGAKLVTNQSELDAYLQNFAENTTKGFIRGVRLRGSFSGTSQNIASPCKIIIDEATTLNFSEELCLISKDKVIARRGLNLFGKDVTLKAPNRVIIQDNATIDLSGDLTLHSHGPTEESRAHIRHSANVKVNNLTLRGLYRSTLGKESTYEAQGKISVFSTGEERPTDEDISEWSTVWGDTTIQANEFEARALWRVKVGTRTAINASKITLDGQGCKIGRDATLTALEKQGRCLLPNRPVARFKISPKEASIGESILLDGSRSQNAAAGESFRWRIDMPNGERIDTRKVEGPTYEFTPTQAGEHTIELRVYDQDGFHDWKKKKLIVRGSELFSYYKFELEEEKLSLIYEGRALSDERSIVEAFYTAPDGNRIDVGRRVLGHVDVIDSFDATEPVDLKLTVVDDLGTREEFTHTIEPRAEFQRPVLNFETIEYAPNELVFFSNFMFDPYNQLSDFDGFTLDFGDESSVEINAESFSTTHLYSSEGQYPAKIYAGDYENQKEVTVTGSPSSFEFPLADFKVDGASWAPGVRLYVDQTISPASPIQSYLWRLGDGTTAYGPEVLHFYNEGAYDVSLTVVLDNGTSSTVTREVIIMQTAPNLVGTVDCYDIGDKKAECHVEALDKLSDLKTLNINFGDSPQSIESTTVSGQWAEHTFIHSYEETGNYTVTMQALTNRGEEFFTTTEVAVGENPSNLPPVAILGCYPVYQDVICYSDSSYDPDGYITNYEYDFGDGTVINTTDTEVFHRFETTGTFTINLTVTDNFGVTASYPETVVIEEKPNEFPVPQLSCVSTAPHSLTCEGRNSYDPDGSITIGRLTAVETGEVFETNDLSALQKTFIFTSGGLKTIVIEVTDNQGAVVPLQRDFNARMNELPYVSISCSSTRNGELNCNGSGSSDDGQIVSYDWIIEGINYSGESISVSGLTQNEVEVTLTLTDDLGAQSISTIQSPVMINNAPIADFSCTSPSPWALSCDNLSSDLDGNSLTAEWIVNGQTYATENLNLNNIGQGGSTEVSLRVTDGLASDELVKTIDVVENLAPTLTLDCQSNDHALIECSSSASDQDGTITSYEWFINDIKQDSSDTTFSTYLLATQARVKLIVSDNLGSLKETEQIVNIDLSGVVGEINCYQSKNYEANCNLSYRGLANEPSEINWTVDGVSYGQGESITIIENDERELAITAELVSIGTTFNFNSSFSLTTIPNSELPSPATLNLLSNAPFISTNGELEFELEGGSFLFDESNQISVFEMEINGNDAIPVEILESNYANIKVSTILPEGRHTLYVTARDSEEKIITFEKEIFVGSKNLALNIQGYNSNDEISFFFEGEGLPYLKRTIDTGYIEVSNFPAQNVIFSVGEGVNHQLGMIKSEETSRSITLASKNLSPSETSIFFENGFSGWSIERGSIAEVEASINQSYFRINRPSISLLGDSTGVFSGSTLFKATETNFLEMPIGLDNLQEDDLIFIYAKNLNTGEEFTKRIDLSIIGHHGKSQHTNFLPKVNDQDELYLTVLKYSHPTESTVYQKIMNMIPIGSAIAQSTGDESEVSVISSNYSSIRASDLTLSDGQGYDIGEPLKNLIAGSFPELYNQWDREVGPIRKVYRMRLTGDLEIEGDIGSNYTLEIEICANGEEINCIHRRALNCDGDSLSDYCEILFYEEDLITYQNEPRVSTKLIIKSNITQEQVGSRLNIAGADNRTYFRVLRSASADGIVGGSDDSDNRYGARAGRSGNDDEDGMDDWYAISHQSIIENLMGAESKFGGATLKLRVDDISPAGVSRYDEENSNHFGHNGHNDGIQLDLRFIRDTHALSQIENRATGEITEFAEDGKSLIEIFEHGNGYIRKMLVTNNELRPYRVAAKLKNIGTTESSFLRSLAQGCTSYGEYPLAKIGNFVGHSDHVDIALYDVNSSGVIPRFERASGVVFPNMEDISTRITYSDYIVNTEVVISDENKDNPTTGYSWSYATEIENTGDFSLYDFKGGEIRNKYLVSVLNDVNEWELVTKIKKPTVPLFINEEGNIEANMESTLFQRNSEFNRFASTLIVKLTYLYGSETRPSCHQTAALSLDFKVGRCQHIRVQKEGQETANGEIQTKTFLSQSFPVIGMPSGMSQCASYPVPVNYNSPNGVVRPSVLWGWETPHPDYEKFNFRSGESISGDDFFIKVDKNTIGDLPYLDFRDAPEDFSGPEIFLCDHQDICIYEPSDKVSFEGNKFKYYGLEFDYYEW